MSQVPLLFFPMSSYIYFYVIILYHCCCEKDFFTLHFLGIYRSTDIKIIAFLFSAWNDVTATAYCKMRFGVHWQMTQFLTSKLLFNKVVLASGRHAWNTTSPAVISMYVKVMRDLVLFMQFQQTFHYIFLAIFWSTVYACLYLLHATVGHPCAPFGISTPSLQCPCSLHLRILQLEKHKSMHKKMLLINYRLPLPNSGL